MWRLRDRQDMEEDETKQRDRQTGPGGRCECWGTDRQYLEEDVTAEGQTRHGGRRDETEEQTDGTWRKMWRLRDSQQLLISHSLTTDINKLIWCIQNLQEGHIITVLEVDTCDCKLPLQPTRLTRELTHTELMQHGSVSVLFCGNFARKNTAFKLPV